MAEETLKIDVEFANADAVVKGMQQMDQNLGKRLSDLKGFVTSMAKDLGASKETRSRIKSGFMAHGRGEDLPEGMGGKEKLGVQLGKVLTGSKGFEGLGKQMKGIAASNIPMGKAFAAGGMMGGAMAGVGAILGIVKNALGQSSIFNTVAKSFWTIMGTMADIILMPMLPYMFKFIQWMMTSVMPWVLKVSEAVGSLLQGDASKLTKIFWKLLWDVAMAIITR